MDEMTNTRQEELVVFPCQGSELVGYLHRGSPWCRIGVLAPVPGGPQYRAGVGRQLVRMARHMAGAGIPVMRFDQRGMGDSEGTFGGFLSLQEDLSSAIEEFRIQVPGLSHVVLWGGCDAATAALINAWRFKEVAGVIAGNPFVKSANTVAVVRRRYFFRRLFEREFWSKLIRLQYNPLDYIPLASLRRQRASRASPARGGPELEKLPGLLLEGLEKFEGKILFLMSDRFLTSEHFDTLVSSTPRWRAAIGKPGYSRCAVEGGGQLFSTQQVQDEIFGTAEWWLRDHFLSREEARAS